MDENIWELRKSFEGLVKEEERQAILAEASESDQHVEEPVSVSVKTASSDGLNHRSIEKLPASNAVQRPNSTHVPLQIDTPDQVAHMQANLDLSLGDQLDSLESSLHSQDDGKLTFDDSAEQPKYSPKLSIEDHLDRITMPKQTKRTSIISQRSAISADLANFTSANAARNSTTSTSQKTSISSLIQEEDGTLISCHNVSYEVKMPPRRPCQCGVKDTKFILKDISGLFRPGLNAILGQTGSGKTSLLDVMSGRKDPQGLSGHVLINGGRQPHNFKCMAGYVIQEDTVMSMLSVKENIHFSAALRLPASMAYERKKQRVEDLITELGLGQCADTKIGTELRRGVSGGEKKRTSIAMELITSPAVLFLDEPTSGLDANTAFSVMHLLQKLALCGKTIIFSIHQPRYSIFKLFNTMTLLTQGECVYQGAAKQALEYFKDIGYVCETHNNPADFFLDVLSGGLLPTTALSRNSPTEEQHKQNGISPETEVLIDKDDMPDDDARRHKMLLQQFRKSSCNAKLVEDLRPIYLDFEKKELNSTLVRQRIEYPLSWFGQLRIVSWRTFRNIYRNPHALATQSAMSVILAIIVGCIYFQVDQSYTSGIQNRIGAFFFIVMNYVFSNMSVLDLFIKERALFIHENVSGFYRVSTYFMAKVLCEVVPMRAVPIFIFSCLAYWMIGLSANAFSFFFFIFNICITSLCSASVVLLYSATVSTHTAGTALTTLTMVFMMVFSGLLVNLSTMSPWLSWFKYFSIFRYSMNAFIVNELSDMEFCDTITSPAGNTTEICDYGNAYMDRQSIAHTTSYHLWLNELSLLVMSIIFLTLTYVQLRRIQKHR